MAPSCLKNFWPRRNLILRGLIQSSGCIKVRLYFRLPCISREELLETNKGAENRAWDRIDKAYKQAGLRPCGTMGGQPTFRVDEADSRKELDESPQNRFSTGPKVFFTAGAMRPKTFLLPEKILKKS